MAGKYSAAVFSNEGRVDLGEHTTIIKAKDACQAHASEHSLASLEWDAGTSGRDPVYLTARTVTSVYHVFYPEKAVELPEPVEEVITLDATDANASE